MLLGFTKNGFVFSSCSINVEKSKLVKIFSDGDDEEIRGDCLNMCKKSESSFSVEKSVEIADKTMTTKDMLYDMKSPEQRLQFLEKKYLHDYFVAREKEWIEIP